MDKNKAFKEMGISMKELRILERYCSDDVDASNDEFASCNDSYDYSDSTFAEGDFSISTCDY
ncbi:hypothetical protein KUL152_26670 [Tenacibaculum sp. KUL152]|uniref:hypothetical protein n=1 Tax=unclassified Alteromonas TaxID=2614992 RepID=UPI0012E48807|nr:MULTISPECIES: hypothetical protein [unclassified Alteromonas]BCO17346.1 hypothetical protein KUC3_02030 [Alteromonas sp. KC3]BCO21335.1 hypothetical protein KUC14_02040 [Alteromonas sp. KC14]GFD90441.1 hypothetical protein KUL152_26670 [Tenacibaculum sp. KUL152]